MPDIDQAGNLKQASGVQMIALNIDTNTSPTSPNFFRERKLAQNSIPLEGLLFSNGATYPKSEINF